MEAEVLVAQFSTEPEAYIAAGMLAAAGVVARVEANNMATLYGAGATWAPINLYVSSVDAEYARTLLDAHNDC